MRAQPHLNAVCTLKSSSQINLQQTPYANIARVIKARGLEGKVLVRCAEGLSFCLYEGLEVHIVPPTLFGVRHGRITELKQLDEQSAVVALEGLDSIDDAEELAGRYLLARRSELDLEPLDDINTLLGRGVVSDDGRMLGAVSEYLETNANDVLVVERAEGGELLIPIIDDTIVDVPLGDEEEPIVVHLLEGLEEL